MFKERGRPKATAATVTLGKSRCGPPAIVLAAMDELEDAALVSRRFVAMFCVSHPHVNLQLDEAGHARQGGFVPKYYDITLKNARAFEAHDVRLNGLPRSGLQMMGGPGRLEFVFRRVLRQNQIACQSCCFRA